MSPTILVVDDDDLFRGTVVDALSALGPDVRVEQAADGQEAWDKLQAFPVDVLLTDLNMPNMDGIQLLQTLLNRRYEISVVVVTAFGTPALETQVASLGAMHFVDKPVELRSLVTLLGELLRDRGPSSVLTGVTLAGFVQLVTMERMSCSLKVLWGTRRGTLELAEGELVHADDGVTVGDAAALAILGWPGPTIEMRPRTPEKVRTVTSTLQQLLLDAMRLLDEAGRLGDAAPVSSTRRNRPAEAASVVGSGGAPSWPAPAEVEVSPVTLPTPAEPRSLVLPEVMRSLEECMMIEGTLGAALADWQNGRTLGAVGGQGILDIGVAATANCHVLRAKMDAMTLLGITGHVQDILITLEDQYHILRPLRSYPNLFLYLATDRSRSNLGLCRLKIEKIEQEMKL